MPNWTRSKRRLPGVFEISFAFSPWSLGAEVMKRFEIPESEWQHPNFNFLRRLGFTKKQIDEANDVDLRSRHRRRRAASQETNTCPSSTAPTSAARSACATSQSKAISA